MARQRALSIVLTMRWVIISTYNIHNIYSFHKIIMISCFVKKVFNKFDANKGDSSLVTARSKYHLHVNEWEKAVLDARAVLEESSNMAQAYLSKVEGLFNLCCFEEVIMFDDKI